MFFFLGPCRSQVSPEDKLDYEAKAVADKDRYIKECEEAGVEPKLPKAKDKKVRTCPPHLPLPRLPRPWVLPAALMMREPWRHR